MVLPPFIAERPRRHTLEARRARDIGSVARWPIFDRLLGGLVHLLGRHQHDRLHCRRVALICGERYRGGGYIVGQIDGDIGVDATESEEDALQFAPHAFRCLGDRVATAGTAFLSHALRAFWGVMRFEQIFWHERPPLLY